MTRALVLAAVAAVLGACAAQPRSHVEGVADGMDAAALAAGAADMIAAKVPTAGGPVALTPTSAAQADNRLTPALANTLRARGYRLADRPDAAAHAVRYNVVAVEGAVVLNVAVDGWNVARPYARTNGRLVPAGPASVETPSQEAVP